MNNLSQLLGSTTNRLVAINVLVFFIVRSVYGQQLSGFELYYWQSPQFHWWQLITHMFMHGGVSHLAFNMLALWSFGRVLESVWGGQRFFIYYLICGLGAALIHLLVTHYQFQGIYQELLNLGFNDSQINSVLEQGRDLSAQSTNVSREQLVSFYSLFHAPTVGASGAVYGVLVAFALLFPDFKIILLFLPIPIAAKFLVPVLLLIDLMSGVTGFSLFGANIAHFAHIGGAVVGFCLLYWWRYQANNNNQRW